MKLDRSLAKNISCKNEGRCINWLADICYAMCNLFDKQFVNWTFNCHHAQILIKIKHNIDKSVFNINVCFTESNIFPLDKNMLLIFHSYMIDFSHLFHVLGWSFHTPVISYLWYHQIANGIFCSKYKYI